MITSRRGKHKSEGRMAHVGQHSSEGPSLRFLMYED